MFYSHEKWKQTNKQNPNFRCLSLKESWVVQSIDGLMGLDAIYVDEIKQYIEWPGEFQKAASRMFPCWGAINI